MNVKGSFTYDFFPVGQGLFSAGRVGLSKSTEEQLLWVYDCGTASSRGLIDQGLEAIEKMAEEDQRIDLLVLSHFDDDHINGVCRLLKRFKVGTLMLPYMDLAQRLLVCLEEGEEGNPLAGFYINSVDYLLGQGVAGIERIVLVPPSGTDGPEYPGSPDGQPLNPEPNDLRWRDRQEKVSRELNERYGDDLYQMHVSSEGSGTSVEVLEPGSNMIHAKCFWEFIPFNDDPDYPIADEFIERVDRLKERLLAPDDDADRADALDDLKLVYDRQFGHSPEKRNIISLFLYSGPLYAEVSARLIGLLPHLYYKLGMALTPIPNWLRLLPDMNGYCGIREVNLGQCSLLYSGDGSLNTSDRLYRVIKYLNQSRIDRVGVFQVMHHGSKKNWHRGVEQAISPLVSVFCADPSRASPGHPDMIVLHAFWDYGAVIVDQSRSLRCGGSLAPR